MGTAIGAQGIGDGSPRASGEFLSAGVVIQDSFAACLLARLAHGVIRCIVQLSVYLVDSVAGRALCKKHLLGGCVSASVKPIGGREGSLPLWSTHTLNAVLQC